jgi:hypothetical protein
MPAVTVGRAWREDDHNDQSGSPIEFRVMSVPLHGDNGTSMIIPLNMA